MTFKHTFISDTAGLSDIYLVMDGYTSSDPEPYAYHMTDDANGVYEATCNDATFIDGYYNVYQGANIEVEKAFLTSKRTSNQVTLNKANITSLQQHAAGNGADHAQVEANKDDIADMKGTGWVDENLADHETRIDALEGEFDPTIPPKPTMITATTDLMPNDVNKAYVQITLGSSGTGVGGVNEWVVRDKSYAEEDVVGQVLYHDGSTYTVTALTTNGSEQTLTVVGDLSGKSGHYILGPNAAAYKVLLRCNVEQRIEWEREVSYGQSPVDMLKVFHNLPLGRTYEVLVASFSRLGQTVGYVSGGDVTTPTGYTGVPPDPTMFEITTGLDRDDVGSTDDNTPLTTTWVLVKWGDLGSNGDGATGQFYVPTGDHKAWTEGNVVGQYLTDANDESHLVESLIDDDTLGVDGIPVDGDWYLGPNADRYEVVLVPKVDDTEDPVKRIEGPSSFQASPTAMSRLFRGLPQNETYNVYVRAWNRDGSSSNWVLAGEVTTETEYATAPPVPTRLRLTTGLDVDEVEDPVAIRSDLYVKIGTAWIKAEWGDTGDGVGSLNTFTRSHSNNSDVESSGWVTNEWVGHTLTDEDENTFVVSANDANTLTVDGTPATGDYVLGPNAEGYDISIRRYKELEDRGVFSREIKMKESAVPMEHLEVGLVIGTRYSFKVCSMSHWMPSGRSAYCPAESIIAGGTKGTPGVPTVSALAKKYAVTFSWSPTLNSIAYQLAWTDNGEDPDFDTDTHEVVSTRQTKFTVHTDAGNTVKIAVRGYNEAGGVGTAGTANEVALAPSLDDINDGVTHKKIPAQYYTDFTTLLARVDKAIDVDGQLKAVITNIGYEAVETNNLADGSVDLRTAKVVGVQTQSHSWTSHGQEQIEHGLGSAPKQVILNARNAAGKSAWQYQDADATYIYIEHDEDGGQIDIVFF